MKINEITEGWKSAAAGAAAGGLLGGIPGAIIGGGLGALGLSGLDKLGGGTGVVGTRRQREVRAAELADKEFKKKIASFSGLGHTATQRFLQTLRQHGVSLQQGQFDPKEVQGEMKYYATEYFAEHEPDPVVNQYVKLKIEDIPLPSVINPTTIEDYFDKVNNVRTLAFKNRYLAHKDVKAHKEKQDIAAQNKNDVVNQLMGIVKQLTDPTTADANKADTDEQLRAKALAANINGLIKQVQTGEASPEEAAHQYEQLRQAAIEAAEAAEAAKDAVLDKSNPMVSGKKVRVGKEVITKRQDGNWYDQNGEQIVNARDVEELERRANRPSASAGAYVK